MSWFLGLLLACSPVEVDDVRAEAIELPAQPATSEQGPVTVIGAVSGWDGSGDVAIEACGVGVLVDEEHRFVLVTDAGCPIRVVWERAGRRAEGRWHALAPEGRDQVEVVLPIPTPEALRELSESEQQYREDTIREAQRQLHQEEGASGAAAEPRAPS